MSSHFKIIGVNERVKAMNIIHDYIETTYFPSKLDEVIHCLLRKQVIHTVKEITDKLIHGDFGIEQLKDLTTDLTTPNSENS